MVLISIRPFDFKRIFLLVVVLLCLSSAICFADSLFMSLSSARSRRQLNRTQPIALSVPERSVQPPFPVAGKLNREFAHESEWMPSESSVRYSTTNWLADRWEEVEDDPCIPLRAQVHSWTCNPPLLSSTDKNKASYW